MPRARRACCRFWSIAAAGPGASTPMVVVDPSPQPRNASLSALSAHKGPEEGDAARPFGPRIGHLGSMCASMIELHDGTVQTPTELPSLPTAGPIEPQTASTLEFQRLTRSSTRYRWWRPLVVGLGTGILFASLMILVFVGVAVAALWFPGLEESMNQFLDGPEELDLRDPFILGLSLISLALLLPAVLLASRMVGVVPVGWLSSVSGRIRWRWLAHCSMIAATLLVVVQIGVVATTVLRGEPLAPYDDNSRTLSLVVIALLLVPFQAAAEEYIFRGYLMQTLGGWFRNPLIAIMLPVPFFVIGHGYGALGMTDVAVFGVAAGWLSWRTGGLEAAIALHVVNNLSVSILGAFGVLDLNATDAHLGDLIISVLATVGFSVVVIEVSDRIGIDRTRTSPVNCRPTAPTSTDGIEVT